MESDARLAARIGSAMAQARRQRGWSQDDLAERLDLSKNHVGFLERGARLPSVGVLVQIARGLDLSLDAMLLDAASAEAQGSEVERIVKGIHPELRELVVEFLRNAARQPDRRGRPKRRHSAGER